MRLKVACVALLAVTTVATASCAANVAGHPGPGLTPVDISTLKTGPYSPEPSAYEPYISTVPDLRTIEARRMLNYLVHSYEINKDITVLSDIKVFTSGDQMVQTNTFPERYRAAASDNNLLLGVYVSRINESLRSRKKLIISVLRFPTDADSQKAVTDFDQVANADPGRHPISIQNHPDAKASSADDITGISFIAHGPYVVMANIGIPEPNPSALADIFGKTIDKQVANLDRMQPTPLDDVLDLPLNPDGLMRRALPKAPDYSDPFIYDWDFGPYQPAGELHFERNPAEVAKAFEDSGVDLVARRGAIVYRTRDVPAAFRLQTALVKTGKDDEVLDSPPGLPDARCVKLDKSDPYRMFDALCVVVYGRYVAVVQSKKTIVAARVDVALNQRAAAQYAVLAKSEG